MVELVVAIIAGIVALAAAAMTFVNGRRANTITQFGANLALNKYIDERVDTLVEERIGDVREELREAKRNERIRTNAFIRILRSIAAQWPPEAPHPVLDRADIEAVEETTIPSAWLSTDQPLEP